MTTHTYFDLFKFIENIHSPEVAAQVAQSTAWRIDTMIVGAARQLYKNVREALHNSRLDQLADITTDLNQQAYAETSFEEIGSHNTGPIATIKQLEYQREAWHELARRLTCLTSDWQGKPRTYVTPEIEDQIFNPGKMKVATDTKRKLMIGAKRFAEAYDMPDAADALYQKRLDRQNDKLTGVGENMKNQAAGVNFMYAEAKAHDMEIPQGPVTAYFHSLSVDIQRILLNNAIAAAERAEEFAAGDRNMRDSDYDMVCLSALKASKDLRAILKTSRFMNAAEQETAGERATG